MDFELADDMLGFVVALVPHDVRAYTRRAVAFASQRRIEDAKAMLEYVRDLPPAPARAVP